MIVAAQAASRLGSEGVPENKAGRDNLPDVVVRSAPGRFARAGPTSRQQAHIAGLVQCGSWNGPATRSHAPATVCAQTRVSCVMLRQMYHGAGAATASIVVDATSKTRIGIVFNGRCRQCDFTIRTR